jgi:hypothetical protein
MTRRKRCEFLKKFNAIYRMKTSEKNTHLSIFECIDQLLSVSAFRSKTFTEKLELYFTDFSMMSLMVAVFFIFFSNFDRRII